VSPDSWVLGPPAADGHAQAGLDRPSVINCDGIHTVTQKSLTTRIGQVSDDVMRNVCSALSYALGC